MTLGNATAPERVIRAFGQDAIRVEACDREHTWVPTYRDDADLACFFRCGIDCCEVLRDVRVRVERIDHVEELGVFRRLFGQVSCGTTTQHEHVDIVRMGFDIVNREDRYTSSERSDGAWVATREDGDQLDVVILTSSQLNTFAQVSVSQNADARFHHVRLPSCGFCRY